MALNFPDSPSTNDTYTVNNTTWTYNGTVWKVKNNMKKVARFTSTGTWTVPSGVTYAVAHILGGGGGGAAQTSAGGNGGNSSVAFAGGTVTALGGVGGRASGGAGFSGQPDEADNSGRGGCINGGTFRSADAQWVVAGDTVTPGASITVTVGAGGISGTGGNPGGEGGSGYVWIEYQD